VVDDVKDRVLTVVDVKPTVVTPFVAIELAVALLSTDAKASK
jgi:hypothetical protein